MLGLGSLIGGGVGLLSGIGSAISGSSKEKDNINRARNINKYSALTGRAVEEPGRTKGGFWDYASKGIGGAVTGAKMGSSIEKGFNDLKNLEAETAKIKAETAELNKIKKGMGSAVRSAGKPAVEAIKKATTETAGKPMYSTLQPTYHEEYIDPMTLEQTGGYSKAFTPSPQSKPETNSFWDYLSRGNTGGYGQPKF